MEQLIAIRMPAELEREKAIAGVSLLSPTELLQDAPDAHWILSTNNGEAMGRLSLWWSRTPSLPGHRLGLIGHYTVCDAVAAHRLLQHACEALRARGCTLAVGPMDGNSWRRYRFLTERGNEPVFFLEPDNPDDWPSHFLEFGFTPLATYCSAINTDLSREDSRIKRVADRLAILDVHIRPLNPQYIEDELRRIYEVSRISFQGNFLFTQINEAEFMSRYLKLLPYVRPELVLIAESRGKAIGFLLALPDHSQAMRGETIDTVILKTVAVLPERGNAGLGSLLVARGHQTARELGYTRAIHALMHESNNSRNISGHYAQTIRRYALFAKSLRGEI